MKEYFDRTRSHMEHTGMSEQIFYYYMGYIEALYEAGFLSTDEKDELDKIRKQEREKGRIKEVSVI